MPEAFRSSTGLRWLAALALACVLAAPAGAQQPQDLADAAEAEFLAGRVAESVAAYDRLVKMVPSIAPVLWQRGIGLFYLGRYAECAEQFRNFHERDRADVEGAAWHYLCVARAESPAKAREQLLPAGPDNRIARTHIYEMLAGRLTPAAFIEAANASFPIVQFYAHMYVGLYLDVNGDRAGAREHIRAATREDFREFGGFLNAAAQIHLQQMDKPQP